MFVVLTALIIPFRGFQWGYTLGEKPPPFRSRYHAVAIGAFFHNAIPGKLGDRLRTVVQTRPGLSIRDIALEALEEWLARHGAEAGGGAAPERASPERSE